MTERRGRNTNFYRQVLLHRPSRGRYQITTEGRSFVASTDAEITEPILNRMALDRQSGDRTPVTRTSVEN